jgi:hypothetical protein
MEEQIIPDEPDDSDEIAMYTLKAIAGSAILGGPIAAVCLIAHNFSAMQREMAATYTRMIGVAATLIGIPLLMILYDWFFLRLFVYMSVVLWLIPVLAVAQQYQGEAIGKHLFEGGRKAPGWKTAIITLTNTVFLVLYIMLVSYLKPSIAPHIASLGYPDQASPNIRNIAEFETSDIVTEFTGCHVYFDADSIVRSDAKIAGAILENVGYFYRGKPCQDALFYKKDGKYIIAFEVGERALTDKNIEKILKNALEMLHKAYKTRKYQFRLVTVEFNEITNERIIQIK